MASRKDSFRRANSVLALVPKVGLQPVRLGAVEGTGRIFSGSLGSTGEFGRKLPNDAGGGVSIADTAKYSFLSVEMMPPIMNFLAQNF